mgnify:CR=1 FL=1
MISRSAEPCAPRPEPGETTAQRFCRENLLKTDGQLPDVYIIPSAVWLSPNAVLVDRKYDKDLQI